MTELQSKVVDEAERQMKDKPWFRGVCLDKLKTDHEIERDGFDSAVDALTLDTWYWDGMVPNKM